MYPGAQKRYETAIAHCFAETLEEFLQWLLQKYPNCSETQTAHMKVIGVILNNGTAETKAIASFGKCLNKDVTKQCSYGKAFACLSGRPLTLHEVSAYKDPILLHEGNLPKLLVAVNPKGKYETCDVADRKIAWGYIQALVKFAQLHSGYESFEMPSRDEIAMNISKRAEAEQSGADPEQKSVQTQAVCMLLNACAEINNNETVQALLTQAASSEEFCSDFVKTWMSDMDKAAPTEPPVTFAKAIADKNIAAAMHLPSKVFKDLDLFKMYQANADKHDFNKLLDVMDHVNSILSVQSALPTSLMRNIESKANTLRNQMMSGDGLDFASLSSVGMDVMAQCSPQELQACMANINNVMPHVQKLATAVRSSANEQ